MSTTGSNINNSLKNSTQFLIKYLKGSSIAKNSIYLFSFSIFSVGIEFVSRIVLARNLETTQFGIFSLAIAWQTLLVMVASLGLNIVLVKYISIYTTNSEWYLFKGIIKKVDTLSLIASTTILTIAVIILHLIPFKIFNFRIVLLCGCITIPFIVLATNRYAILQGLKHAVSANIPEKIIDPVLFLIIIIFFANYLKNSFSATHTIVIKLTTSVFSFIALSFLLNHFLPKEVRKSKPEYKTKLWVGMALPMLIMSGMNLILKKTDIIMLGALSGPDSAGIYSAATQISRLAVFVLSSVNTLAAPIISQLYNLKDFGKLQKKVTQFSIIIFFLTIPIVLGLLIGGKFILNLFGSVYTFGYVPLIILLAGQLINALSGSVGFLMIMTKYHKEATIIFCISALINIILNFFLIPVLGVIGAAVSTAITTILWNISMIIFINKALKIDSTIIPAFKSFFKR